MKSPCDSENNIIYKYKCIFPITVLLVGNNKLYMVIILSRLYYYYKNKPEYIPLNDRQQFGKELNLHLENKS